MYDIPRPLMFLLQQEINTAYIWGQGTFILISKLLKVINTKNSQTGQFIAKYGRNTGQGGI